jgi:hypothetical protein
MSPHSLSTYKLAVAHDRDLLDEAALARCVAGGRGTTTPLTVIRGALLR